MTLPSWILAAVGLAALVASCSSTVIDQATAGGTSGSTGGGTAGGPPATICGGKQGLACPPDQWCRFEPAGSCGVADGAGTCEPRPTGACPPDCPGVCGCDGAFYCSACAAESAGVDVGSGSCVTFDAGGPDPIYTAFALATNLPRYVVFKAEPAQDRCVMLIVAMSGGSSFGLDVTMGWAVEQAVISNHASDCALGPNGYPPQIPGAVQTSGGMGGLKQDSTNFPCLLSIHATLTFPPGPAWVPSIDQLDVDALGVQGGCLP
jgi:hypothetical protein